MTQTSKIGPFALEERLSGAVATYRGIHIEQHRAMAIKVFSAPFGTSREARMTFALEWEKLKALRHPRIVRCFGGGMDDMRGYLVYELVPGESVASLLKRRGRLAWDQVVEFALEIVSGLEFLHENDVHHLALAPEKLLLQRNSGLKIADLRYERHKNLPFQSSPTITAERAAYMAPEQFDDDARVGPKTDMYALGCVLYTMLTGRPPFVSKDVNELARMHRGQEPERVSRLVLDCPIWIESLVQQLLEKDPLKRPYTMSAVRLALEESQKKIAEGVGVAQHVTGGISALKTDANRGEAARLLGKVKKKKKRKAHNSLRDTPIYERAWFLGACLVLLALLGVWLMWPPSEEELYRDGVALLSSGSDVDARRARVDFFEPLLKRFPDGKHAPDARKHIERIAMKSAEDRLRHKLRLRRELTNEGERLLAEAWEFQQFGDSAAALEKFQSMADILPQDEIHRPYRNIALREIAALRKAMDESGFEADRKRFLDDRLRRADELAAEGKHDQAVLIWRSIISLYRGNPELQSFVDQAYERLDEPPSSLESRPTSEPGTDVPS